MWEMVFDILQKAGECVKFSEKLKTLRKRKGLSQQEFSKIMGIAQNTLSNWELGNRRPDYETLNKIADYFGVTVDDLISRQELPEDQPVSSSASQFGNMLRLLREQKNLKQKELGDKFGVKNNTISNWESGRTEPGYEVLIELANFFSVSIDYLLGHNSPVMNIKFVEKVISNEFRGKALESELWVYGAYIYAGSTDKAYIQMYDGNRALPVPIEIDPHTAGRYTQGYDMRGDELYEDDLITGSNGVVMVIRYGEYQAYCPVNEAFMRSVGFYAAAPGYPDMPIGNTDRYATKIGNIHDNPDIWNKGQENF